MAVRNDRNMSVSYHGYDRHAYLQEKRHALEIWAQHLGNLTVPPPANVVQIQVRVAGS